MGKLYRDLGFVILGFMILIFLVSPVSASCSITGPTKMVLHKASAKPGVDANTEPAIVLNSEVSPPGGEYAWEILSGQDKVRIADGSSGPGVTILAIRPSEALDDVTVRLRYTHDSQTEVADQKITVQVPTALSVADGYPVDTPRYNSFDEYVGTESVYLFCVKDQLTPANTIEMVMKASEINRLRYSSIREKGNNGIRSDGLTSVQGCFSDTLAPFDLTGASAASALPWDFSMFRQQIWYLEGWPMETRCQMYEYIHARSVEGRCDVIR